MDTSNRPFSRRKQERTLVEIVPSILSTDFSRPGNEIKEVELGEAHYTHVDVMDGHIVPNFTIDSSL